jgi:trans-aconitate methyltransferase
MPQTEYLPGHSEKELERLTRQARLLRPITERLLREIGLKPGMRVLDLGCGAGANLCPSWDRFESIAVSHALVADETGSTR